MSTYQLPKYEQHPLAIDLMPGGMNDAEFEAFCKDVEERGIIFPATIYEGKVLDGWHRYRAAKKTGSRLEFRTYEGKDPSGYICSVNAMRRKMSSLQRCLVAAKLCDHHGIGQREACKRLSISNEALSMALKVLKSNHAVILKRIETDAEYTRGQLREDMHDAGLLEEKKHAKGDRPRNSAFDVPEDEEDGEEHEPGTGKKRSHPERRPKATPPQILSDDFKALEEGDKVTFLRMIWPEASNILKGLGMELVEPKKTRVALTGKVPKGAKKPETPAEKLDTFQKGTKSTKPDKKTKAGKLPLNGATATPLDALKTAVKKDKAEAKKAAASVDDMLGKPKTEKSAEEMLK